MPLQKCYQLELKSVQKLLFSKDRESVILGYKMLRKSPVYRKLKTSSLFYYPYGFNSGQKYLVKTLVKKAYNVQLNRVCKNIHAEFSDRYILRKFKDMLVILAGSCPEKVFRREFLVTDLF